MQAVSVGMRSCVRCDTDVSEQCASVRHSAVTERLGNPRADPGLLLLLHRAEREQQRSQTCRPARLTSRASVFWSFQEPESVST